MDKQQLIDEVNALPDDERLQVVDSVLRSLNPPTPAIDADWATEARRRLADLRTATTPGIPADQVFSQMRAHYRA